MDIETPKDITSEMRNPQAWWDRYHGYGADCDVVDTNEMLKSYADRVDSALCELYEQLRRAEDAIHVMAEQAGRLDVAGATSIDSLVDLCQRCRGNLLDSATEYWKFKIAREKDDAK